MSAAFAFELLRAHPELARHAREGDRPGDELGYFTMSLRPPSGRESALVVDTGDRDRVHVAWGRFSAEFDAPTGAGRSTEFDAALDLVEDIISDRVAVYVVAVDGRWRESGTVYDERDEQRVLKKLGKNVVVEFYSWEGTRDARYSGDDLVSDSAHA